MNRMGVGRLICRLLHRTKVRMVFMEPNGQWDFSVATDTENIICHGNQILIRYIII